MKKNVEEFWCLCQLKSLDSKGSSLPTCSGSKEQNSSHKFWFLKINHWLKLVTEDLLGWHWYFSFFRQISSTEWFTVPFGLLVHIFQNHCYLGPSFCVFHQLCLLFDHLFVQTWVYYWEVWESVSHCSLRDVKFRLKAKYWHATQTWNHFQHLCTDLYLQLW